ncbi:MAG: 30S ribosomal protein S11 [Nanoarchaeota archaeon]|nr:30S ribosomal protein S11 [Nanoarchaeota archaeon]
MAEEEKAKMAEEKISSEGKVDSKAEEGATEIVEEVKKDERPAIAYIYSTQNNTFVHMTDLAGNTLSRVSGGMVTKHSRLKADPTVAMFVAKKAASRAKDLGITALYIRTRAKTGSIGMGSGAHAAVKSLSKEGFRIINILDATRVARGGPKKKGGKRGRRV